MMPAALTSFLLIQPYVSSTSATLSCVRMVWMVFTSFMLCVCCEQDQCKTYDAGQYCREDDLTSTVAILLVVHGLIDVVPALLPDFIVIAITALTIVELTFTSVSHGSGVDECLK